MSEYKPVRMMFAQANWYALSNDNCSRNFRTRGLLIEQFESHPDAVFIRELFKERESSRSVIVLPIAEIPNLIIALRKFPLGELGRQAIDAEYNHLLQE